MSTKFQDDLVANQLPGWRIVEPAAEPEFQVEEVADMKVDTGPSIAQLRKKFLGIDDSSDAAADVGAEFAPQDDVDTVQVQPEEGGPAKTADIRNGKVTIVQG